MSNVSLILKSIAELAAVVFIAWGFINENKLVRFERRVARIVKLYIRDYRAEKALEAQQMQKQKHAAPQTQYARHRRTSMPADPVMPRRRGDDGGSRPQHPRKVA